MKHLDAKGAGPSRVVIVGAGGFVGAAIAGNLSGRGVPTISVSRSHADLLSENAAGQLAGILQEGDAVVFVSAIAPVKDYAMFRDNIVMMKNGLDAMCTVQLSHVLYISSDAVYTDSLNPLSEESATGPDNLHGIMHVARETMLRSALSTTPIACLRPTLIYGAADPHNGYGPNRFRRQVQAGESITLFGEGEERRDHIAVEDVAELAARIIMNRSIGVLNAATGRVASFYETAELTASFSPTEIAIQTNERQGAMPHNGYRPFDSRQVIASFPDFNFTRLEDGLRAMYNATAG